MQQHQEHPGTHSDAPSIMDDLVHVDFVKFVSVDAKGNEQREESPALGYLVYNGHCREFGLRSLAFSDSYTLGYDIYQHIAHHHPKMSEYILRCGGFFIGGIWQDISQGGEVTH